MKQHSELQEDNETRRYILKNKHTGQVFHVLETFHYYKKRGAVFPAQYSRTGRQIIEVSNQEGGIVAYDCLRNVYESTTARKKNIFKFLSREIQDLKNFESILIDKVPHLNCLADCVELVKSALKIGKEDVKQANEEEAGFVEIVFKYGVTDLEIKRIKEVLDQKIITCKFEEPGFANNLRTNPKKMYIKYLS